MQAGWWAWLEAHHDRDEGVWLVLDAKHDPTRANRVEETARLAQQNKRANQWPRES